MSEEKVEGTCKHCGLDIINNAVFTHDPHWVHTKSKSPYCYNSTKAEPE